MNNDRELLELAAKAADYKAWIAEGRSSIWHPNTEWTSWNPLTNDGDALRLAVKLNLLQKHSFLGALGEENDVCDGDYYAATRRAIVHAAAEIGKDME